MSSIKKEIKDFGDLELPDTVFKYRYWGQAHHDSIIKKKEVFLASPKTFIDPLDCRNPVRYDLLNSKQLVEYFQCMSSLKNPHFRRQQRREEVRRLIKTNKGFNSEPKLSEYTEYFNQEYFKREGVLSLTAEPCLDEMWKLYAEDGKGFCVGFHPTIMFRFLGGGGKVDYYDELPVIMPRSIMDENEIRIHRIFAKEKKWEHEEEYRTTKFFEFEASNQDRKIILPKEAYKEVILGKNISKEHRLEITEAVKEFIGNIPIYEHPEYCN